MATDGTNYSATDAVRLTLLRTRESWQAQALAHAGLSLNTWTPASGFPSNESNVRKVYDYYAALFNTNPDKLLWAGLAKLAGGAVFTGLQTERSIIDDGLNNPTIFDPATDEYIPNPNALLVPTLVAQEKLFLTMQQDIFQDLAWQHEAYKDAGLFALKLLPAVEPTITTTDVALTAWSHIDSTDASIVKAGNEEILRREQSDILQPLYVQLMNIQGYVVSYLTSSPVPGGHSFVAVMG
jgi:hypothetical protein